MSRGGGRARLTGRGRALGGTAACLAVLAFLFGLGELWCVSAAAAVLLVAAYWRSPSGWDVVVTRVVRPARVPVGSDARVEVVAANSGGRRSPPVAVRDPLGGKGSRGEAWFSIAPLPPGGCISGTYRVPTPHRGVFQMGPLELRASDPFGLVVRTRVVPELATLIVHPPWELAAVPPTGGLRHADAGETSPARVSSGEEFHMLREYVPGDDIRRVHWPSSARTGELVVREVETPRRDRLEVELDLRSEVHTAETVEAVVSAGASLAVSALRAGLDLRLTTSGGFDSGVITGVAGGGAVLDSLAAMGTHDRSGAGRQVGADGGPAVTVTTDLAEGVGTPPGGRTGVACVVFETAARSPAGAEPLASRWLRRTGTVVVPHGTGFAAAWAAAHPAGWA